MTSRTEYKCVVTTGTSPCGTLSAEESDVSLVAKFIALSTVKILKFGTPQTIAIIVLKIEKFDVSLHKCIQKMLMEW